LTSNAPKLLCTGEASTDTECHLLFPLKENTVLVILAFLVDGCKPDIFLEQITPLVFALSSIGLSTRNEEISLPENVSGEMGSLEGSLRQWISSYESEKDGKLYAFIISQMDNVLLPIVLEMFNSNKSRASKILGINRNTLRKKIESLDFPE